MLFGVKANVGSNPTVTANENPRETGGFLHSQPLRGALLVHISKNRSHIEVLPHAPRGVAEGTGAASCVFTRVMEAFSGQVALRPRASAGRVPHPGRPSTARPEYYVAHGEPILSEPPDPSGALHPAFSRYRMGTAGSGPFAVPVAPPLPASVVPGPRPARPGVGPPGFPSVYAEWFLPSTLGLPHPQQTLDRPSQSVAFIISETSITAKALRHRGGRCTSSGKVVGTEASDRWQGTAWGYKPDSRHRVSQGKDLSYTDF